MHGPTRDGSEASRSRPIDQYRTKTDLAADALRRAIASGRLKRGQRLRFADLIADLGVSATPIREALRILETEGLVTMESHKEVRVADFTVDDAREIYKIRAILEGLATEESVPCIREADLLALESLMSEMDAAVASDRLSELPDLNAAWHQRIYSVGASKYLQFIIKKLWIAFPWDTMWIIPNRARTSVEEHAKIMAALRDRDAHLIAELMHHHIMSSEKSVIEYLISASG